MHAGFVAADYIKSQNMRKVYVAGPKEVCEELEEVGVEYEHQEVRGRIYGIANGSVILTFVQTDPMPEKWDNGLVDSLIVSRMDPKVDCVVVGYDVNMSYVKVARAANYLKKQNAKFLV